MTGAPQKTMTAASFSAVATDPALVGDEALVQAARVSGPTGALLFASGSVGQRAPEVLASLREKLGPIPMTLAVSPGVLTERAELEGKSAVTGLVWRGGFARALSVGPETHADKGGESMARQVDLALEGGPGTVVLFADAENFSHHALDALAAISPRVAVIGGGTLPGGAFSLSPEGVVTRGALVALVVRGLPKPAMRASSAVRPLGSLGAITEAKGSMVLRIGRDPALDVLTNAARTLRTRPLMLALLAPPEADGSRDVMVRGIRGVDPARGGVVITDEVQLGMQMGFGICDPAASCAEFEKNARDLARVMAGALPQFGLLMSCAGRGAGLYGSPDVETRLLRGRFPKVPFSGMFSTFEIGPAADRPSMHLYTGVVAVFGAPS
jgi:small ligand-binding sensory domain FIST